MSLRLKTIIGVGLIEATLLVILISTILNYMRETSENSLENYITTTKTLFATSTKDAILSFDLATLDSSIEEILKNDNIIYVRIIDNNNNILASGSNGDYQEKEFKLDNSYLDIDDSIYDTEEFITVEDTTYAKVELGVSTRQIEQSIKETTKLSISIAIIEMVLVAFFSFILGIYLTKQLKVLRNAAKDISSGDYTKKIDIKTRDEVGEVAHAFNKMTNSLNVANQETLTYQQELEELNKTLESRVERRTEKILDQKNKLEDAYGELEKAQEQLVESEKLASIGQLAAGVAHEINNPVGFIKSNLASLEDYIRVYQTLIKEQQAFIDSVDINENINLKNKLDKIANYKEQEDIEFVNDDINSLTKESIKGTVRVEEIVKGLKIYSRDSGDALEPCNLGDCLEDALTILNNEIKYKCKVKKDIATLPLFNCDKVKIIQVFTNLIANAAQAIKDTGILSIKAKHTQDNSISAITITITDNGEGIAKENLSKLFDPFFTTKAVGEGTGLGLSISYGIIKDHGGTISVESKVGVGTRFTIVFNIS